MISAVVEGLTSVDRRTEETIAAALTGFFGGFGRRWDENRRFSQQRALREPGNRRAEEYLRMAQERQPLEMDRLRASTDAARARAEDSDPPMSNPVEWLLRKRMRLGAEGFSNTYGPMVEALRANPDNAYQFNVDERKRIRRMLEEKLQQSGVKPSDFDISDSNGFDAVISALNVDKNQAAAISDLRSQWSRLNDLNTPLQLWEDTDIPGRDEFIEGLRQASPALQLDPTDAGPDVQFRDPIDFGAAGNGGLGGDGGDGGRFQAFQLGANAPQGPNATPEMASQAGQLSAAYAAFMDPNASMEEQLLAAQFLSQYGVPIPAPFGEMMTSQGLAPDAVAGTWA